MTADKFEAAYLCGEPCWYTSSLQALAVLAELQHLPVCHNTLCSLPLSELLH